MSFACEWNIFKNDITIKYSTNDVLHMIRIITYLFGYRKVYMLNLIT